MGVTSQEAHAGAAPTNRGRGTVASWETRSEDHSSVASVVEEATTSPELLVLRSVTVALGPSAVVGWEARQVSAADVGGILHHPGIDDTSQ